MRASPTPDSESELDRRFLRTLSIEPPNFVKLWDDSGTFYKPHDCTIWRPVPPPNFYILGDVMERAHHEQPRSTIAIAVRDPSPGIEPPLLAPPERWEKLWDTRGSGARYGDISIWQPVPPKVSFASMPLVVDAGGAALDPMKCNAMR